MSDRLDLLVVEDNPNDVELMQHALVKVSLTLKTLYLRDGAEALSYLQHAGTRSASPLPRLIFLDLKLPRVDGFEVLKSIRANPRTRTIPIVVLTSSQQDTDIQACYRAGANSYLVKPVDFTKFARAIEACATYWLSMNQSPA